MLKSILLTTLLVSVAYGDSVLLREVEGLRNNLSSSDPGRLTLTLRLADLLFDEAGDSTKKSEMDLAQTQRNRAVRFYEEALSGNNGVYPAVSGALRYKVQFQLARLHTDLAREDKSIPLWTSLLEQTELPELRREAALRLAEIAEKRVASGKSALDAEKYYRRALELCNGTDVCSYSHYRIAWLFYNQKSFDAAISEIQLALFDAKGQPREEAIRDFLLFLSAKGGDGREGLSLIESLSAKLNRPKLIFDLAESYFAAGDKPAGIHVLAFANGKDPDLNASVRLLEEYYGARDWNSFRDTLGQLKGKVAAGSLNAESEKILRRLGVQLDGERNRKKEVAADFQAVADLYLVTFPASPERMKMMEGWLASEDSSPKKIDQLKTWLTDPRFTLSREEQIKLHEFRASLAQKTKDYPVVASEMEALTALNPNGPNAREYRFHQAAALYQLKQEQQAVPVLKELAKLEKAPDNWAVRSQALLLEMAAKEKRYTDVILVTTEWLSNPAVTKGESRSKELVQLVKEMQTLAEQARFENAAGMGETSLALKTFHEYCQQGLMLPKSCDNAKVLAVRLKDQATLISVLQILKQEEELANEYEAAGHFKEAAALLEKNWKGKSPQPEQRLRVALLYELGHEKLDRDRLLLALKTDLLKAKEIGKTEAAFLQTVKEAGLLTPDWLRLPWSENSRLIVSENLEATGKGNAQTKKLILASKTSTGPMWKKYVLEELNRLDREQAKIQFYGKNSQKKFESRLNGLKKAAAYAENYLSGADAATRVEMLELLAKSHRDFADTILQSPIPPGLEAEQLAQVQNSLLEMAKPFQEKSESYAKLTAEQKAIVVAQSPSQSLASSIPEATLAQIKQATQRLHLDPNNQLALSEIKQLYEKQGQARLASYFQGRLKQLVPNAPQPEGVAQ